MPERRPRVLHLELDVYPPDARAALDAAFEVVDGTDVDDRTLAAALEAAPYAALFVRLGVKVDRTAVAGAPDLRLVVTPTTGLDHLDVDGLRDAGVRVLSLRDARQAITGVHATAEHTWGLLLACLRRIPAAQADVVAGRWRRAPFLGTELSGRTIGIVGHGRLGRRVAGYARAFGMQVLVYDIDPAALTELPEGTKSVDADTLLASSDVVTLHLPLDETTRGWLDAPRIDRLRSGAVVVNTARGELVDEAALATALSAGRLAGVATDVAADDARWSEGVGASPLLDLLATDANLVVTPHIGGWAEDAVAMTRRLITELAIATMAEGGGFEPPRVLPLNTDSSRAP